MVVLIKRPAPFASWVYSTGQSFDKSICSVPHGWEFILDWLFEPPHGRLLGPSSHGELRKSWPRWYVSPSCTSPLSSQKGQWPHCRRAALNMQAHSASARWGARGAGPVAELSGSIADPTVESNSRQPAGLGWGDLGKASLCGDHGDINNHDDCCYVLSRIQNRFFTFLVSLTLSLPL